MTGPLLATVTGGWLDQSALCKLVCRLARAADIPSWNQLCPHSLRHIAITLALAAGAATRRTSPDTATPHHPALAGAAEQDRDDQVLRDGQ